MDSGNDSLDNLKVCFDEKVDWLIKRNLRKESVEMWLEIPKIRGDLQISLPGKKIYRGDIYVAREGVEKPLRQVFEVTVRTRVLTGERDVGRGASPSAQERFPSPLAQRHAGFDVYGELGDHSRAASGIIVQSVESLVSGVEASV